MAQLIARFQMLRLPHRLYVVALTFLVFGYGLFLIKVIPLLVLQVITTVSGLLFALGFVLWVLPGLRYMWSSRPGKVCLTLLHGLVFLLAVIPARLLVADALGLPPQDFEITVAVWSILLYPSVWLFVTAVCTFFIWGVFLLLALLLDLTTTPLFDLPLSAIGHLFPEASRQCTFLTVQRHVLSSHALRHALGAMCATFFVLFLLIGYEHAAKGLKPVVRWIAYLADFQDLPRYPGLERDKRARLHENGVVSYAERNGWDISISVTRVSDGDAK